MLTIRYRIGSGPIRKLDVPPVALARRRMMSRTPLEVYVAAEGELAGARRFCRECFSDMTKQLEIVDHTGTVIDTLVAPL